MTNPATGRLYVVATPIGNLGDMSDRARATLASASLIAAEDTRRTGMLLNAFGVVTPMLSLHEHNEGQRVADLVERMRGGATIALVSDAGTPGINDPGFDLVRACGAAGIAVIAVPGPCALIAALSIAGLPTDRFCFEGFLPAKPAARRTRLAEIALETRTLVLYEAPHRVREALEDCAECFGAERPAVVARELTKLHETLYRGTLGELAARAGSEPDFERGEIVLMIAGASAAALAEAGADGHGGALDRVLAPLLEELPLKQAAHLAARIAQVRDNEAYKRALALKQAYGAR
ncbi:MAG TPA: 16S rRNA (cytidine(1402)-2'-O)-methyltransferase [Steroidobacteraceae bacterium]|nr:16S rRNA (cytidine(1402)-2'-O)-methyltransferase [Steroidobacteraceae bacterium]